MTAARRRGEVAIGLYPMPEKSSAEEPSPVWLNPPRDAEVPVGKDTAIVVLADPPDAPR